MKKTRWNDDRPYGGRKRKPWHIALVCLLLTAIAAFAVLEGLIGLHSRTYLTGEPEIMVIFGCKVESWGPSTLLQDRLNTALDYLEDHPDVTVVVSGGKGNDEHQSEAQAMHDYLTEHGFQGTILLEDQSRNTWQNVNHTLALLEEEDHPMDGGVVVVSNGFHLMRIGMLWNRAGGGKLVGTLAAPTSHLPSAIHMFFREPLALVKSFLFDR